jgi:hypothetical protein
MVATESKIKAANYSKHVSDDDSFASGYITRLFLTNGTNTYFLSR